MVSKYADITLSFLIILVPIHVPILLYFFKHRHSQVFKSGCSLELTYLLILGFWFVSAWKLACSFDFTIPCVANGIIASLSYFVVIVVYMQRALKVLFRFEIQAALDAFRRLPREEQTIKALESGEGGWYFRHRNLVRNKYSFFYFALAFSIFALINVGLGFSQPVSCTEFNLIDYLNWLFDILVIPFAVVVACKMKRHPNDAFNIKRDLGWAGISAILITILSIAGHQAVPFNEIDDINFMNAMFAAFTMLWLVILSGYKQMYLLYVIDRQTEVPDYTSLETLLKLESGYESYLKYLKTEFSGENLLFWQAVEDFRKKHIQTLEFGAAFVDSEQIVINYVRTGSPMELNIDTFLREQLIATYQKFQATYKMHLESKKAGSSPKVAAGKINPSADDGPDNETAEASIVTMFDHVQTIVFDLMRKDPFRRYLSSPLYEEFKAAEDAKREQASTSSNGIKVVVETVTKKLSFLTPKTNLNRLSKSASDHSDGSHSALERESQYSAAEREKDTPKDKDARGFSFSDGTPKHVPKPAALEMTASNSTNAPTTPRGSSYVSPFGNAASSPARASYVSPFGASGGGGLAPSTPPTSYVSPFGGGAARPDNYSSPFGGSATTARPENYSSPFGGSSEASPNASSTTPRPDNYSSPFGSAAPVTTARPDNYNSPFGGSATQTTSSASQPAQPSEVKAAQPSEVKAAQPPEVQAAQPSEVQAAQPSEVQPAEVQATQPTETQAATQASETAPTQLSESPQSSTLATSSEGGSSPTPLPRSVSYVSPF